MFPRGPLKADLIFSPAPCTGVVRSICSEGDQSCVASSAGMEHGSQFRVWVLGAFKGLSVFV